MSKVQRAPGPNFSGTSAEYVCVHSEKWTEMHIHSHPFKPPIPPSLFRFMNLDTLGGIGILSVCVILTFKSLNWQIGRRPCCSKSGAYSIFGLLPSFTMVWNNHGICAHHTFSVHKISVKCILQVFNVLKTMFMEQSISPPNVQVKFIVAAAVSIWSHSCDMWSYSDNETLTFERT